ncbi:MAG: hypothetical protein R2865_02125 [Deinococcales bacterium]
MKSVKVANLDPQRQVFDEAKNLYGNQNFSLSPQEALELNLLIRQGAKPSPF